MNNDKKSTYHFSIIRMIHSIWNSIFSNEWMAWVFITLISLLTVLIWLTLSQTYLSEYTLTPVTDSLVLAIMFGTWGYLGYLAIRHRFFPSDLSYPMTGKHAPLVGIIVMIIGWGFSIYSLYLEVSKLIKIN